MSDRYRVTFVYAPDPVQSEHQNFGNKYLPLWALTLAAHLPDDEGLELKLFDTRIDTVDAIGEADLFLMSGMNQDCGHILAVHERLRERFPQAKTVVGGPMTWSFDQSGDLGSLDPFDHVAIGDGEDVVADIVATLRAGEELPRVMRRKQRFDMTKQRHLHRGLLEGIARNYYGGVLEVSRGCPFLCEFCDIRIQPDNNRTHDKSPELVVEELDFLSKLGVSSFMFACDNFIGDQRWAHKVVDQIVAWKEKTGFAPSIFTWLTINLYKDEALMRKMRLAGFDVLFIGVETFNRNSLLETAKVQNRTKAETMPEILRRIQAFGFMVTPGLIFGFDSDDEQLFDLTVDSLEEACLLTCNHAFLVALPGTPLYRRMKLAGRLREEDVHISRYRITSNIRYLLPKKLLVEGYVGFVQRVSEGRHQYRRFRNYLDNLSERGNYVPIDGAGYGSLGEFLRNVLRDRIVLANLAKRMARFAANPTNVFWALAGLLLVMRRNSSIPGGRRIFTLWLYGWTNLVLQSRELSADDIDIQSLEGQFTREDVLPAGYSEDIVEDIPKAKTQAQIRATVSQLSSMMDEREAAPGA